MKQKHIVIAIIAFTAIFLVGCNAGMSKETVNRVLSYEEVPDFVKNSIKEVGIVENNNMHINGNEEHYIVLTPPEGKSVEILYVGEDENMGYGLIYKYAYTDKISDKLLDNIKIIHIKYYNGTIRGTRVKN